MPDMLRDYTDMLRRSFGLPSPIYSGSNPADSDSLPSAQIPAQTLASGPAAGDGEWSWTLYDPAGADASAHLDDSTLARPTYDLAAAQAAGFQGGGKWTMRGTPTVAGVSGSEVVLEWLVGEVNNGVAFVDKHNVYWPDEATVDLLSEGSGTYDSVLYTVPATNWTSVDVTNATGLVCVSSAGGDAKITRPRQCSDVDVIHRVWVALTHPGGTNKYINICGWISADTNALIGPNLGHNGSNWILRFYDKITGAAAFSDFTIGATVPTVIAIEYDGSYFVREIRYSTAAFSGTWPAWSAMSAIRPASRTSNGFQTAAAVDRTTAAEYAVIGTDEGRALVQQSSMTVTYLGHRVQEAL